MQSSFIRIIPLTPENHPDFVRHMDRHIQESGVQGVHFMPFIPGDNDRPTGVAFDNLMLGIEHPLLHWIDLEE